MIERLTKLSGLFVLQFSILTLTMTARADEGASVDQGWTDADLKSWYETSAGSRLIPLSWLLALEQPDNDRKFLEESHIAKFRYLPGMNSNGLPLPLGFTIDAQSDKHLNATKLRWKTPQGDNEPWVGMNCSACHTADITFKGKKVRIQGGPTLADFQSFMTALDRALVATRDEPDKWSRFAAHVLGDEDAQDERARLKDAFDRFTARRLRIEAANETPLRYGYGRLDAFGHIFNDIALSVGASNPAPLPSDAPVSYPFLWNIPQHDKVQWDGIAPNTPRVIVGVKVDPGALARNAAGMLGVFVDVDVDSPFVLRGYKSSLPASNIVEFEDKLGRLRPPRWPSQLFGAPDPSLVEKGSQIFAAQCARCHGPLARDDLQTHFKVKMTPFAGTGEDRVGTDPTMACNVYVAQAASGSLKGAPKILLFPIVGDVAPARDLVNIVALGALVKDKRELVELFLSELLHNKRPSLQIGPILESSRDSAPEETCKENCESASSASDAAQTPSGDCMTAQDSLLAYKARPLTGIWATAPYLHNGSVPTLYDLLLPPDQRPKSFFVGTREFDPQKVGFATAPSPDNDFLFETRTGSGDPKPGNSNLGHEFGVTLTEDQRRMLIEYLKTL